MGGLSHNPYFFLASFFAISALMPYGLSFYKKRYIFMMFTLLFIGSILGGYLLNNEPYYFWIIILVVSFLLGFLETNIGTLKKLSAWTFIGLLYGSFELQQYSFDITWINYLNLFVLGLICITTFVYSAKIKTKTTTINIVLVFSWQNSIHYFKYTLYFIIALIVFRLGHVYEPQWYLWSGLSVLNLNTADATIKIKHRINAGSTGLLMGFLTLNLLPTNFYISTISYIGIMLSLMSFKLYSHGFGLRCFFIVLFAANQGLTIGQIRFYDIIAGGVIGFLMSHLLAYINQKMSVLSKKIEKVKSKCT
ncbi:FUSC family protein [Fastidiosibacter lacustris]|uniref:FUSC family protein n=1 Tax=Fastidiosibacter lacustris TaxID=2056695 RepID=UPI0013001C28|nr:FUSC family protein [Fastidiosibacter lacustris]